MTAPQHDAKPPSERPSEQPSERANNQTAIRRQKLQRCWFVGMGLLGGFGFVTSQMSFALAETNFLTYTNDASQPAEDGAVDNVAVGDTASDYTATSYAADSYTQVAADLAPIQPTFEVQTYAEPMPVPEAFVEAPAAPAEAMAPFATSPSTLEAPAALPIQSAVSAEMAQVDTYVETPVLATGTSVPAAEAIQPTATTQTATPSIQIEITPLVAANAATVAPTVTAEATPTFSRDAKPAVAKASARRAHPLAGLLEANAVAAPLSAYANSQATLISNVVDMRGLSQIDSVATLAMVDEPVLAAPAAEPSVAVEITPEVTPEIAPTAVPDILPAPAAPAIVEIEPAAEAAPPLQPVEITPAALPEGSTLPEEYNGIFVDPTDYSIGATESPDVVVSEQSTGCEFTVGQAQGVPNGACGLPNAPAPVAGTPGSPAANGTAAPVAANAPAWQDAPAATTPVASAPSVNVGPVSFSASGIQLSTSAAGRDYLNRSVRPLVNLQATEQFIFPLAVPSPITSLFGFRTHPIFGDWRFHAGTDIGAEQGTPVLAAQDGVVAAAEAAGGYGLMVVLRHKAEELELESRYAHLAEIFVEAGEEVKKGDIVGLVGSTGNSTGPHLHFEMRQLTADGWVPVNADSLVQNSLANLINALNNPMETLSFNLSDFNLSNLRAKGSIKAPTTSIPTFQVGEDGIPFRPAQPNAS